MAVAIPNAFEIGLPSVSEADLVTSRAPESGLVDGWGALFSFSVPAAQHVAGLTLKMNCDQQPLHAPNSPLIEHVIAHCQSASESCTTYTRHETSPAYLAFRTGTSRTRFVFRLRASIFAKQSYLVVAWWPALQSNLWSPQRERGRRVEARRREV